MTRRPICRRPEPAALPGCVVLCRPGHMEMGLGLLSTGAVFVRLLRAVPSPGYPLVESNLLPQYCRIVCVGVVALPIAFSQYCTGFIMCRLRVAFAILSTLCAFAMAAVCMLSEYAHVCFVLVCSGQTSSCLAPLSIMLILSSCFRSNCPAWYAVVHPLAPQASPILHMAPPASLCPLLFVRAAALAACMAAPKSTSAPHAHASVRVLVSVTAAFDAGWRPLL